MSEHNLSLEEILFDLAVQKPTAAERAAFLDHVCRGNPPLRAQLDELLEGCFGAAGFLPQPASPEPLAGPAPPIATEAASSPMIGRYKLLEKIGEGGFGEVWMAEQREPVKRRVALKIIKPGMDSRQIVARFEAERQALAMMDHPNIAKIFDAGTTETIVHAPEGRARHSVRAGDLTDSEGRAGPSVPAENQPVQGGAHGVTRPTLKSEDGGARGAGAPCPPHSSVFSAGRPYFVMELVRGIKITEYCDENQLPVRERLTLFIKVCQAIQHAHQKGIIHRDIKPSNILVTLHDGVPVPKVIDFGIAKATHGELTDKTVFTQFQQFIGTPAYISPEQAEMSGLDIDTRADIYSLGVLLYELLAGQTPFDTREMMQGGLDALRKIIREKEPLRPSTRLTQALATAGTPGRVAPADRSCTQVGRVTPCAPSGELISPEDGAHGSPRQSTAAAGVTRPTRETDEETRASLHRLRLKERITAVRGDLDCIVMKCLEKDRGRRYETANGLATDIQRYLSNEPIIARRPSAAYKIRKTWQRNRLACAAAAAVGLALIAATGVSTWQAIRATKAGRREASARLSADEEKKRAEKGELEARKNLYLADMNAVQQALQESNLGRANLLLEKYFPRTGGEDLRGIEWRYLWNLCQGTETLTLDFNHYPLCGVAFSSDGRLLALAGTDNKVTILDLKSQKLLKRFSAQFVRANSQTIVFSRDGKYLAAAEAQAVTLWRTKDWQRAYRLDGDVVAGHGFAVDFSPDAKTIATACDGKLALWDAADGRLLSSVDTKLPFDRTRNRFTWSTDGKTIAITGNDRIELWTVQPLSKLDWFEGRLHDTISLKCSTNWLAAGGYNGELIIWDIRTGRELVNFKAHPAFTYGMAFSPDGQTLATGGGDQKIHLWDLNSLPSDRRATNAASAATQLKKRATLQGHLHEVSTLAFSPDGQFLASGSKDGSAKLWNVAAVPTEAILPGTDAPLRFSSDGKTLLALNTDETLSYWDVQSRRNIRQVSPALYTNQVTPWTLSVDGKILAIARTNGAVEFLDVEKGTRTATQVVAAGAQISGLNLSPSRRLLLIASANSRKGESKPIVRISDLLTGEQSGPLDGAEAPFAFSPDGRTLVSGGVDFAPIVWDVATLRRQAKLRKHTGRLYTFAFAPDGKLLVTASLDNTMCLWDAATWTNVEVLRGHMGGVIGALFSGDGKTLISASAYNDIKMWDVENRRELIGFNSFGEIGDFLCSPDLSFLAVAVTAKGRASSGILLLHAPSFTDIDAAERAKVAARIQVPMGD